MFLPLEPHLCILLYLNTYAFCINLHNLRPAAAKTGPNLRDWATTARSKMLGRWDNWHEPQVAKPPHSYHYSYRHAA